MKAKKGQILVLILILMAVGLIIMSPLLSYLNSSYNVYLSKLKDTTAYYTVDAMMGKIFSDMYAGENVYILNASDIYRYNNQSGWLNGYKISTSINNSIANPPPPSSGSEYADWIYMDPGCAFGLSTLAHNDDPAYAHAFKLALTGGTTVTTNWYFRDTPMGSCNYYGSGKMWIAYENGSTVQYNGSDVTTGVLTFIGNSTKPTGFQGQLTWTVPQGGSGNYTIKFQNLSYRKSGGGGCPTSTDRGMINPTGGNMTVRPTFSGIGDPLYTWVRMGNSFGGQVYQYQDYTITSTARLGTTDILSVTACVRQTPGSLMWWEHQSLAVVSWIITYY